MCGGKCGLGDFILKNIVYNNRFFIFLVYRFANQNNNMEV